MNNSPVLEGGLLRSGSTHFRSFLYFLSLLYLINLPLFAALLHEQDVFFLGRSVPKLHRFERTSEVANFLDAIFGASLSGMGLGNFFVGSVAIEELGERPSR